MKVKVHETISGMRRLIGLPLDQRPAALRDLLQPMYAHVPVPGDPVDLHHGGGGFRVDQDDARYGPALDRLSGIEERIESALHRAADALAHVKLPEQVQVLLVLGNPDDSHLMTTAGGYYGMGSVPGWIYLLAWPSDEVVNRIEHCAVHEFHHQARYSNVTWDPVHVTVGEHVVAEGLAEAFVRELSGPQAMGPWSGMVTGEAFDRAYEITTRDIWLEGMQHTLSYVLGDTSARKFGRDPRGIPDMAGYAVGLHLVDAHLAASGLTAAASTALPSKEILAATLSR
ncbi:DUF2268 domain-containing protein [Allorhizocola rhizosphaerae]|uniref:DUF2268 domain-containing protein n=1 Tax=Allorhizocola rhizosphaerae TaxID=1872709 RepID=UPI000E3CDD4C|nr:DUF2268 domain-containing putative Zn-dependent protease [Allorhizocola rhizosphaerae]